MSRPRRTDGGQVDEREQRRRLDTPLASLPGLSVRTVNTLENDELFYVRDVVFRSLDEMRSVTNLGRTAFEELKAALAAQGVHVTAWGMHAPKQAGGRR